MDNAVLTEYHVSIKYPMSVPVRIAHVSDLHERKADDILALLKAAKPDIIAVTGDTFERYDNRPQYDFDRKPIKRIIINIIHYTNWFLCKFRREEKQPETDNAFDFLRRAARVAPVYLSLGNHEQKLLPEDRAFLAEMGITLLDNDDTTACVNGFRFRIGGMSSWDFEDWLTRFSQKDGCKILLSHHPERFEKFVKDTDIALMLSGHTHGGQARVGRKGRGFFVPGQGIFGKYAHGMFFGGRLIVSSGCANTVAVPRFFNPRELVLVHLFGED